MKTKTDRRLFWFMRDETELDLANPAHLDMYVQQILSSGNTEDVKRLLKAVGYHSFKESFNRTKNFLSSEVKNFWEEGLGDIE